MQERLLDGAPLGSQATVTDNDWIHEKVFLNSQTVFAENIPPKKKTLTRQS